MPRTIDDPQNPQSYVGRDLTLSVRLLPGDRVQVEQIKDGLDASRVAIVRALIRAGLDATGGDPGRLAEHLRIPTP